MKKVVCIAPDDLSALIFCKTLSRLLSERGDTELVTVSGRVEGQSADMYKDDIQNSIISRHIVVPMRRFISPIQDIAYFYRLYRILKREKCSAIVTFTTKPNIYGQIAAFVAGVPLRVMAVRGLGRVFNANSTFRERALKHFLTLLYRLSCRLANRVWFTNQGDLDDFVSANLVSQEKSFITRNAVDLTDFCMDQIDPVKIEALRKEFGLNPSDRVVVMVARLIEQKGVREFVEAAVTLRDDLPQLYFLLVAPEEPDNPSMIPVEYIRDKESCSNLHWLAFRKDVRELYALSDLSVLPSYYKEGGYPRALLEAMAYGKPVIAANTPECRGPVEDGRNGFLVEPKDSAALAQAIEKIITQPDLSEKMGACSLARMHAEFDDQIVFGTLIDEVLFPPSAQG